MATITTKTAKNGAINFYNAETGKRVAEASVVEDAIENGGTFYTAKTLRYSGNFADKNFASPITAYKWLARTSDGSMEIVRCDRVNGKSTYTTIYQIGCDGGDELIESAELEAYLKEIRGTSGAFTEKERREEQITLRMKSDNLSREQAEELVDYIRANREHYNSEVAATVKAMLDNFNKINNPEPAIVEEPANVEDAIVEEPVETATVTVENAALPTESTLPKGIITVNSGADAWDTISPYFPNGFNYYTDTNLTMFNNDDAPRYFKYFMATVRADENERHVEVYMVKADGSTDTLLTVHITDENADDNACTTTEDLNDVDGEFENEPAIVETANEEPATAAAVEVNVEKATFAVGKTYVSDWETEYTVIKRTAKTVTIVPVIYVDDYEDISENPFVKTRRIHSDNNGEILSFNGSEGEALINAGTVITIRATDEVKSEAPAVEEPAAEVNVRANAEVNTEEPAEKTAPATALAVLTPAQIAAAKIVNSLGNVIVKFAYAGEGKNGGLALHYETFNSVGDEFPTDVSIVEVFKPESYILDHVNVIKGYGDDKQIVKHLFKDYYTPAPVLTPAKVTLPSTLPALETERITAATVSDAWNIISQRFSGKFIPGELCECWDGTATAVFHNGDLRLEVFRVDGHNIYFDVKRNDIRPFLHIDIDATNPPAEPPKPETPVEPAPVDEEPYHFTKQDCADFARNLDIICGDMAAQINAKAPEGRAVTYKVNVTLTDDKTDYTSSTPHFVTFNGETVAEIARITADDIEHAEEFWAKFTPQIPTEPAPDSPCAIDNNLTDILQNTFRGVDYMDFTAQDGAKEITYPRNLHVEPDWENDTGYVFANGYAAFARYETPEQVIDVMTGLRDTIKAGKTEFTFPAENDNEPPKPPVDEFKATLAALDADVARAESDRDAAKAALANAEVTFQTAFAARQDFLGKTAGKLTDKLHDECRGNDFMETATASGCPYTIGDITNIYIDPTLSGKFAFVTYNNRALAQYDTPAQVETVIARIKDAIARHEPAFYFPTIEELNAPPETPVEPAPVDVKITFDRILKARRHGINHVTTKQGRHMWYICGRLANKKEITEWLADEGFTVDEYIAAEKVADKYENEVEFPRRMAIYAQAEFLWDKIAADKQASVEPLPALFPADDSDDDEPVDPPVEPVISKEQLIDSLTRAMQTAMEKFQGFCRVKNLTAANNEMKLYNICREATRELWKE